MNMIDDNNTKHNIFNYYIIYPLYYYTSYNVKDNNKHVRDICLYIGIYGYPIQNVSLPYFL